MNQGLNLSGWLSIILGWGAILGFSFYCMYRILFDKKKTIEEAATGVKRERWATRLGLVLAMAGNAIGLGQFLRFPAKAASNGGGAFLIPYFCALILMGVPMRWVEWTIGRHGGARGHGSTPGMFHVMWKHPVSKYIGAFGIFIPFAIAAYYLFIMAWCLGYAWFSATGRYFGHANQDAMSAFLFIMKYITPVYMLVVLAVCLLVHKAWKKKRFEAPTAQTGHSPRIPAVRGGKITPGITLPDD